MGEHDYYAPHGDERVIRKFHKKQANRKLRRADGLYQHVAIRKCMICGGIFGSNMVNQNLTFR